jgi:curli biogenesis system outer membrane secretion channel CsgG
MRALHPVHWLKLGAVASATLLGGCLATAPSLGGGSASPVTGATGGASSTGGNNKLERCSETLGTIRIEENTNASWYSHYYSAYRLGSTVPLLRMMIQQSNCFVVVERGRGLQGIQSERSQMRGDEGRAGSNFGGGQQVGADYSMSPEIMMNARGTSGGSGVVGGLLNRVVPGAGAVAGSAKMNEAGTILLLVDVRSTVQISAAEGYSKNWDFGLGGSVFSALGAGGGSGYTNTPEGKLVAAAFVDAYNKMVVALREYKAQTVRGGLGAGGRLGVQGGQTEAGREVGTKPPAKK